MVKRITYIVFLGMLLTACSGTKNTTAVKEEEPTVAPEGVEFKAYTNIAGFSHINIPMKGNGFETKDMGSTDKLPSVKFHQAYVTTKASFTDKQGDFAAMFEILKPKYAISTGDNSTTIFEETTIGKKQVARIDNIEKNRNGSVNFTHGYMIKHGDQMGVIMLYYANFTPAQVETRRPPLEETLQYMIKTLEFNE